MPERIIVLGGGIIGLACAFEAACRGAQVTVLEPGAFGGQASGAAAGMLAPYTENAEQPDPFFRLCLDSLRRYGDWTERIEEVSGRSVELVRSGSLTVAQHEADVLPLQTRLAWQNLHGAEAELIGAERLRRMEPQLTASAAAAVYCPGESHVHAPKLVASLEAACRKLGVRLLAHAGELELAGPGGAEAESGFASGAAEGAGIRIRTGEYGNVDGDKLVVCAGAWACLYAEKFGFPIPVHPIRGQICSYETSPPETVRHMVFSSQAYWVRKRDGSLVCGASEDVAGYDSSVTERGIGRLVRWSPRLFPFLAGREPSVRWAGLRPATRDGWPLIGPVPGRPDIVLAAGHYRNGILLSPVTAHIVGRLLAGEEPHMPIAPFAPERFAAVTGGR